ncbi:MAG: hypothetical protein KDA20_10745, partial [Phycisphaerales bacterium]|nr:hypothetical protein [Phycisphaerales bacterium]
MAFRGRIVLGIALVLTMIAPVGAGNNPDTTFTYQGRLRSGGLPANGTYNVSFSLWTASSGGTQVGPTINRPNLPVTNGVFSQQLDFGNPIITTGRLYLEIVVDAQTLSPRQELTNAFGSIHTRGVHVSAAGDVGIGTDAPMELLDVSGNALMRGDLDLDGSLKLNHGIGETEIRPIGNDAWLVNFATGKLILATTTNTAIASSRITVTNDGLVGIGNSVPSTKLHVLGGTDVTASGGGFLQMGPSNGLNVGLDDNEI